MMIDSKTKTSLRTIVLAQCAGVLGVLLFNNGFMLAYLSRLGVPSHRILFFLSLVSLAGLVFTMPFAYGSDRFGKKRVGHGGLVFSVAGLLLLAVAGSFDAEGARIATAGIIVFSIGISANTASWFALLSPIVPKDIRGRFFARLRISWQLVGILFTVAVTKLLEIFTEIQFFQYVLLFIIATSIFRIHLYRKIPELETEQSSSKKIMAPLLGILKTPGYLPFCAYSFLLSLFTGSMPWIFGLLAKDALLFSDSRILLVSNCVAAGAIAGFYIGGKMVDHLGTKPVFLIAHLAFAVVLFLVPLRDFFPMSPVAAMGLLGGLFGVVFSASGIAFSSELLAIIPTENKSLSTGFHLSLTNAGIALSSLIIGQLLRLDILSPEWTLMGQAVSAYDTVLLGSAIMILLLTITLGLVPSVIQVHKAQWYPQNR